MTKLTREQKRAAMPWCERLAHDIAERTTVGIFAWFLKENIETLTKFILEECKYYSLHKDVSAQRMFRMENLAAYAEFAQKWDEYYPLHVEEDKGPTNDWIKLEGMRVAEFADMRARVLYAALFLMQEGHVSK
jgi:hypothetical protein